MQVQKINNLQATAQKNNPNSINSQPAFGTLGKNFSKLLKKTNAMQIITDNNLLEDFNIIKKSKNWQVDIYETLDEYRKAFYGYRIYESNITSKNKLGNAFNRFLYDNRYQSWLKEFFGQIFSLDPRETDSFMYKIAKAASDIKIADEAIEFSSVKYAESLNRFYKETPEIKAQIKVLNKQLKKLNLKKYSNMARKGEISEEKYSQICKQREEILSKLDTLKKRKLPVFEIILTDEQKKVVDKSELERKIRKDIDNTKNEIRRQIREKYPVLVTPDYVHGGFAGGGL